LEVKPLGGLLLGVGTSLPRVEGDEVRENLRKKRCWFQQCVVFVIRRQDDGVQGMRGRAVEESLQRERGVDASPLDGIESRGQITDVGRVRLDLCDRWLNKGV
jgi:hypothetical protein